MVNAEAILDFNCRGRESVVGRRRRQDDQVDVVGFEARSIQRCTRGRRAQGSRRLPLARDIALADTGPLNDPLVRGLNLAFKLAIGHHASRQRGSKASHRGTDHRCQTPSSSASTFTGRRLE